MCFYYLLHCILPVVENEHGKRNSRLFLFGTMFYLAMYLVLWNLHIYGKFDKIILDAYLFSLVILFIADACVLCYYYRSYFGRSILHEMPMAEPNKKHTYNTETHTYDENEKT